MPKWKPLGCGHGPRYALVLALGVLACARGDVSDYLRRGECNSAGRCADGYVCDEKTWQCQLPGPAFDASSRQSEAPLGPDAFVSTMKKPDGSVTVLSDGSATTDLPSPCAAGLTMCNGVCVDTRTDPSHCGSCSSTCRASGSGLGCGNVTPGVCDCAGNDSLCGATGSACAASTGLCVCGGQTCVPGEICNSDATGNSTCSCDGYQTCLPGWSCCQGSGCVDLMLQPEHCGACGRACPNRQFFCLGGICQCRNDKACQGGTCNNGRCQCGSVICDPGKTCSIKHL